MEQFFKKNSINVKKVDLASNKKGYIIYSDIKIDKSLDKYLDIDFSAKELVEENKKLKSKNISYQELKAIGEDFVHRFYYYQEIIENNKPENKFHATIIMMNPAFAYSEKQDSTIDNIYAYFKSNGFKSFEIINFSPIRTLSPKVLSTLAKQESCNKYNEINRKFVEFVLDNVQKDENSVIIAAWGGNAKDNKMAKKFFENKSYKLYCFGMTAEKYPKHFSLLSYKKMMNFRYPMPYLVINNWLVTNNLSKIDNYYLTENKRSVSWVFQKNSDYLGVIIVNLRYCLKEVKDAIENMEHSISNRYFKFFADRAFCSFEQRKYEEAIKNADYALSFGLEGNEYHFAKSELYILKARAFRYLKDYEESLKMTNILEKSYPDRLALYYVYSIRADIYGRLKNYNEAAYNYIQLFEGNLSKSPYSDSIALALCYKKMSNNKYIEEILYKYLEIFNEDGVITINILLALHYSNMKEYKKVEDMYIKLLEIKPGETSYNRLAWFYYNMKQNFESALNYVNKALICNPRGYYSLNIRANIYYNLKDYENALKDINAALKLKKKKSYFKTRAKIYECLNEVEKVEVDLKVANSL